MIGRMVVTLIALLTAIEATTNAGPRLDAASASLVQRHHYAINARVRPLLVFWISRHNVGDAVLARRQGPTSAAYSLLIGSDPDRAPRGINRWGYIDEEIDGTNATLIGLMTASDEDSIEEAETNIRKQAADRTFKVIRATISGEQARSVVTSVDAPAAYSFRDLRTVLGLARQDSSEARPRVLRLPAGTRPGFLAAVADLMHRHVEEWRSSGRVHPGDAIRYVYHGRIYELAARRTQPLANTRVGAALYTHVITSEFQIKSTYDGELTPFSMTYGTQGPFAEIPLAASFQPRWWLQIELALDDSTAGPSLAD